MAKTTPNLLTDLRERVLARCNTEEELRTLCADLGVNYDDLPAQGRANKARELVACLERLSRIPDLEALLARPRPLTTQVIEDYLAALREYCANLPYLTLHDIRPPRTLDEVYVPLKARPQPRKETEDEDLAGLRVPTYPSGLTRDLPGLDRGEPLSIAEVMRRRQPPHVLILGKPGAGKSTLLRQLAERAWDAPAQVGLDAPHLPILVPLRRLAGSEGSLETRLNRALTAELTLAQDLPQGFFSDWPRQTGARWLILLDALDEVPAGERARLLQSLRGLLKSDEPSRIVITSRPSGYAQGELDDRRLVHYDLLSFTSAQTGEFARKWFGDDQLPESCELSGSSKVEHFLRELERVRAGDLRGTPLLLTIAAKVYLERGTLPERRSALYGQFVEIWLSEAEQRGLNDQLGERLAAPVDLYVARLAHLALRLTEQPGQADLETLAALVAEHLQSQEGFTRLHAETYSRQFVQVMARRSGVFTRRGDAFDFIHPTFREYLAAWAVVRESRRDGGYDLEQVWRRAVSRWADDNWREVALFALSLLSDGGQDVTALVSRVWQEKDGLHFAGAALAEQVRVDESLSDGIIDGLIAGARSEEPWESWHALSTLGELRSYPRAGDKLLALARDEEVNGRVRVDASAALGKLGRADDAAPILLALARGEKVDDRVRLYAAEALGQLGQADEAAPILLALARDEKMNIGARWHAAVALGQFGRADDLLALACDEKADEAVRGRAAVALGQLGWGNEAALILLALARDESGDVGVCADATAALGELGRADDLLALMHDEKVNADVRAHAAAALGQLGRADEAAPILLTLARDEKVDEWLHVRAAETLGELGGADEAAPILLALARNERVEAWVRERAAKALGELGCAAEAAQAWLALARDEKVKTQARKRAIAALGELGRADDLLALARDEKADVDARVEAAKALGELRRADDLLALACNERVEAWVRECAAAALGKLGRAGEAASILLALARDEKVNAWVRERAAEALGELGRAGEATPILQALARDEKVGEWVRACAAAALGQFADAHVLPALEQVVHEGKSEHVRHAVQRAIEQIRRRMG